MSTATTDHAQLHYHNHHNHHPHHAPSSSSSSGTRRSSFSGVFIPVGSAGGGGHHHHESSSDGPAFGRMSRRKDPLAGVAGNDRPTTTISAGSGSSSASNTNTNTNTNTQPQQPPQPPSSALLSNEDLGLCVKCGMQLYQIKTKKKGLFGSSNVIKKVPLSIPGQVERGQCLQCGTSTSCTSSAVNAVVDPRERLSASPSSSSSSLASNTPSDASRHSDLGVKRPASTTMQNAAGGGGGGGGSSVLPSPTSSQAVYEGPFNVYGERDGAGKMTWDNGDVYTGEFFNGNRHGHGTLSFADGSEYVGEWECNVQHGVGTRRWCNGDCYTGQYVNGQRTGEGRFYFTNGDLYIGCWMNGVMQGQGRYYYASGQRFEGIFEKGKRHGKGKLQRTDGSLDIGVYHQDVRVGLGVRWSADRTMAWKMCDGLVKKKVDIPTAVALDYDLDAAAQALSDSQDHVRVV